jgi:hypothetical protein
MPAHTNSFIVICLCMHEPASLTCIRPLASQLDAWPKAASGQHHWLRQVGCQATGPGKPILLSGAGPVSLSWPGVNCTAATFQVAGCSTIRPECAATSSPPRPVSSSPLISAFKRSNLQVQGLPQPFLGITDLYEQCMYRMAGSCT